MATETKAPPEGFVVHEGRSGFMDHNGPFYVKGTGHDLVMGTYITENRINRGGIAHGGFIATLVDSAMGYAYATLTEPPGGAVTINLTIDYAGIAKLGDWVESEVDIQKASGRIVLSTSISCATAGALCGPAGFSPDPIRRTRTDGGGHVMNLYFERRAKSKAQRMTRWWLYTLVEDETPTSFSD